MKTVTGAYSTAKIFTDNVEDYAIAQIQMICDNETAKDSKICVMPDVHPGKVGPVGLTMTVGERVLPNLIGVDIGCGMSTMQIKEKRIEFQKLDKVIREEIPSGSSIRKTAHHFSEEFDFSRLLCAKHIGSRNALLSLGTLGGGNHFLEGDVDQEGKLYITVHSGSRHLGVEVTDYYLKEGQRELKARGLQVPYELTWLEGELKEAYIHDLLVVQDYAALNREIILHQLAKSMKWKVQDYISCIHNYIAEEDGALMLRKGAISAKENQEVIIPINMRDGIILGKGLGNKVWNQSAPHGSGRIMKRSDVAGEYTVSGFKKAMEGIYCSCIGKDTLDESPMAYRGIDEIAEAVKDTVKIEKIIRPVYNFKAGGR
ncbi:MAG: RtcB family protein [Lachnospiraceae bacterium]|nr:RtcB family protein [Lachnospiraceae bacterium]